MTILDEAAHLVHNDRGQAYGHPKEDFDRVGRAAAALGIDPTRSAREHALYMVLVKVSRLTQSPEHYDSIVDIAGYARTYEMILEKEKQGADIPF